MFYRTKPKIVEAQRLIGNPAETHRVCSWIERENAINFEDTEVGQQFKDEWSLHDELSVAIDPATGKLVIPTPHGVSYAAYGDWVVKRHDGVFAIFDEEKFEDTFEPSGE